MVQCVANALTSKEAKAGAVFALYHTTLLSCLSVFLEEKYGNVRRRRKERLSCSIFPLLTLNYVLPLMYYFFLYGLHIVCMDATQQHFCHLLV